MTIKDLIDYLNQFPSEYEVTLGPQKASETGEPTPDYIDLAVVIPDGSAVY
jgi:hypothetical protein